MRKKIATLLAVASLGALCAGLCACSNETKIDEVYKEGNIVKVTYDGSGGEIMSTKDVTIVDMFNPDKYEADGEGYIHIKLREPTDEKRPHTGSASITVTRNGYFLTGWYRAREEVKDDDGDVIDDEGNKLVYDSVQAKYYAEHIGSDGNTVRVEAIPKYTYKGLWDFKTDTVDYNKNETDEENKGFEMTLFAGWIKEFSFDYYYKVDGNWTKYATTSFDYVEAQKENAKEDGDTSKILLDRVLVPQWSPTTGKMVYRYNSEYTFPGIENKTFKAAYTDAECQDEITRANPLQHGGEMRYENETATPVNSVQNVYVEFDEGNRYRISTAKQFADIADVAGIYTVLSDELDFLCTVDANHELQFPDGGDAIKWPDNLMTAEFTGRIVGEGGKHVAFKNIGAQYSGSSQSVGLFGSIAANAVITNVSFEEVYFDIKSANGVGDLNYGMFAGNIEEDAQISVTIGGEWRFWDVSALSDGKPHFNLTAHGDNAGVTKTTIRLAAFGDNTYGEGSENKFLFHVDYRAGNSLDEKGNLTLNIIPNSNQIPEEDKVFEGRYHEIVIGGETI